MPIAQQDASTYFSQGINNQNLQNQFALARQNAGMSGMMEMDKLKQTLDADFAKFNAEMDLKVESFNSTMGFEAAMKAQELAQAQILARAQAWNALDTANISASAQLGVANIHAEASKDVAYKEGLMNIWNNPNISPQQSEVFTDRWQQVNGHATSSVTQWSQAYA